MPRSVVLPPEEPPGLDGTKAGGWWHESDAGRTLVCDLCPRACTLGDRRRGFCFVRQHRDGRIVSTTYGRSTGFCIDPIEKKPLNQFYPGTAVLSFGTAGCNLGCKFCQNWTTTKSRQVDELCELAEPEAIAQAARKSDCRSVAFTYNDPIVWAEYAIDTARACRRMGVKTVAVTSGYIAGGARSSFFEVMDAANVDLKAFSEEFYREFTGGSLQPVLDTLRWLVHESEVWVEITNLIIPQANDSPRQIERMCGWIAEQLGPDVPLHFTAFHPDFRLVDRGPTPLATLVAAHDIARRAGLHYVYTGNVSDRTHQSTLCPGCGRVVIERDGYRLGEYGLKGDRCGHCGAVVAGRFDETPGSWGARREPVRIAAFAPAKPSRPVSEGESRMQNEPSKPPGAETTGADRPQLTSGQERQVFRAAGSRVAAVARSQVPQPTAEVLAEVADRPVLGAFVSLKRGGHLRSCCGYLGESVPLAEALDHAAVRAAKEDPRFPPISPTELDHLDMEVWLLWGLRPVTARGTDRLHAVTIGKHGLQIARGGARGLLLPGVAVEHNLDAEAFLRQVCIKANLPVDAWKDDDTALMTFEGHSIGGRFEDPDAANPPQPAAGGPSKEDLDRLSDGCRQNVVALVRGATPNYYLSGVFDGGVSGLAIAVRSGESAERIECSQLAVRPEMPLQATLFRLAGVAADALRSRGINLQALETLEVEMTVLWDPALHGTVGKAELAGVDPLRRALLVFRQPDWAWVYDPQRPVEQLLAEATELAAIEPASDRSAAALVSLAVLSNVPRSSAHSTPQSHGARPAAVAGRFYPGDPQQLAQEIDRLLPAAREPQPWAGAMVPHAGWVYSGRLAAEVLSRVEIPPQVVIFCPKHGPGGANWAVAPNERWSLPGGDVESDPELARQLVDAVSGLELDAAAHRLEHAIEVQLPLLGRLAPESKVVGVAIGGGDWPALQRFAQQLAELLRPMPQRPLLLISSDMNHFADETETRRLDRLALDALESLDPARLYETVRQHKISMCGMLPAVLVMETLRLLGCLGHCESVGYATSAEASGDSNRVVGYAGVLFG